MAMENIIQRMIDVDWWATIAAGTVIGAAMTACIFTIINLLNDRDEGGE